LLERLVLNGFSQMASPLLRELALRAGRRLPARSPVRFPEMKFVFTLFLLVTLPLAPIQVGADSQKQIVGATEVVFVTDANLRFEARVDTGAKTSSIHAENFEVDSPGDPQGKRISFYLVTNEGQSRKVETRVISVTTVRTSEKSERRYVVPLLIKFNGSERIIPVTLNDRRSMNYRLLLGRNWLQGRYIVDVEKGAEG
jgi:hypothetical protein